MIATDPDQIERIFGTRAPAAIASAIEAYVERELGAAVQGCVDHYVSIGATLVLALSAGEVVLKALEPNRLFAGAVRVQSALAAAGFPAPAVLAEPSRCLQADAYVMAVADRGESVAYDAGTRDAMARWYADLLQRMAVLSVAEPIDEAGIGSRLWPKPHSAMFDFEATSAGAEDIDQVAMRARQLLLSNPLPSILAHTDWSLQNIAIRDGELVAVFDWDSVRRIPEPGAVAGAAAFHCQDWRRGPESCEHDFYPDATWTLSFRDTYLEARQVSWNAAQHAHFDGHLLYALAYQARCLHAVHPAQNPAAERLYAFADAIR